MDSNDRIVRKLILSQGMTLQTKEMESKLYILKY